MDVTKLIEAVITLLIAIITTFIIPYIRKKTSNETFTEIQKWVKIAVQAAEMIYVESGQGAIKKDYVKEFLSQKGYILDDASIENMIESAVLELHHAMNSGDHA